MHDTEISNLSSHKLTTGNLFEFTEFSQLVDKKLWQKKTQKYERDYLMSLQTK